MGAVPIDPFYFAGPIAASTFAISITFRIFKIDYFFDQQMHQVVLFALGELIENISEDFEIIPDSIGINNLVFHRLDDEYREYKPVVRTLADVSLQTHSFNVVRYLIKEVKTYFSNYANFIPWALIAGLGHDIGKTPELRSLHLCAPQGVVVIISGQIYDGNIEVGQYLPGSFQAVDPSMQHYVHQHQIGPHLLNILYGYIEPIEIEKQLRGISCHSPAWANGGKIASCSEAISKAIERHVERGNKSNGNGSHPKKEKTIFCCDCPDCGGAVEHEGGYAICRDCGVIKCG